MQIAPLWHVTVRAVQDWWKDNYLRLAASRFLSIARFFFMVFLPTLRQSG
jgi:hypothetical protein